jgi:mannose-6-phosphate isomerase-like protein (cupin superfamily)
LVKAFVSIIIKVSIYIVPFTLSNKEKIGETLQPKIVKASSLHPYLTHEGCFIAENFSNKEVSIAVAIVKPGITTKAHRLEGIQEIYIITSGEGIITFSSLEPTQVNVGDVIVIPAGASQKITNTSKTDLEFYCVCTPRFNEDYYFDDESEKPL